jgi:hypothetical protein
LLIYCFEDIWVFLFEEAKNNNSFIASCLSKENTMTLSAKCYSITNSLTFYPPHQSGVHLPCEQGNTWDCPELTTTNPHLQRIEIDM